MWDIPVAPRVHFLTKEGEHFVSREAPDAFGEFKAFDINWHTIKCNTEMVVISWRLCAHRMPTMDVDTCQHYLAVTCEGCGAPIRMTPLLRIWVDQDNGVGSDKCLEHRP